MDFVFFLFFPMWTIWILCLKFWGSCSWCYPWLCFRWHFVLTLSSIRIQFLPMWTYSEACLLKPKVQFDAVCDCDWGGHITSLMMLFCTNLSLLRNQRCNVQTLFMEKVYCLTLIPYHLFSINHISLFRKFLECISYIGNVTFPINQMDLLG